MNLIENGRCTEGHLLSHFSEPESVYLGQKYVKIYRVGDLNATLPCFLW